MKSKLFILVSLSSLLLSQSEAIKILEKENQRHKVTHTLSHKQKLKYTDAEFDVPDFDGDAMNAQ